MMTATTQKCRKCGFDNALWHYSSDNMVNWTACPKCRSFFDDSHQIDALKELRNLDETFWKNVEEDTGFKA